MAPKKFRFLSNSLGDKVSRHLARLEGIDHYRYRISDADSVGQLNFTLFDFSADFFSGQFQFNEIFFQCFVQTGIEFLERGYTSVPARLRDLGATIEVLTDDDA